MKKETDNWEGHWENFSAAASWNPAQIMRHNLILKLIALYQKDKINLLDLGCGQGDFLAQAKRVFPEARLVGLELSEQGASITRKKVQNAEVIAGDLLNPPKQMAKYQRWADLIICSEVLEHLDHPGLFLHAACSYLSAGGKIIITVPGGPISAFDRHIGHRQHFNRRSMGKLMDQCGLVAGEIYSAGFPFFNLYRLAIILRGQRLVNDVTTTGCKPALSAKIIANIFKKLFVFNLDRTPFGWQMVAVGYHP